MGTISPLAILLSKDYHDLTQEEWLYLENVGVVNGCGGSSQKMLRYVLNKISPYWVVADCKIHDFGYAQGGTEERRLYCDQRFLEEMLNDGFQKISNKFEYLIYSVWCLIAYLLIRSYGSQFFSYRR